MGPVWVFMTLYFKCHHDDDHILDINNFLFEIGNCWLISKELGELLEFQTILETHALGII